MKVDTQAGEARYWQAPPSLKQIIFCHHRFCIPSYSSHPRIAVHIPSTLASLAGADMSKKRKLVASTMDDMRSERRNGKRIPDHELTNNVPWPPEIPTTATSSYEHNSVAASFNHSAPPTVSREDNPAPISRPLEPTPLVQSLPVAEFFCPSGFDMLEILVHLANFHVSQTLY